MGGPAPIEWDDLKAPEEVPVSVTNISDVGSEFLAAGDGGMATSPVSAVATEIVSPTLKL